MEKDGIKFYKFKNKKITIFENKKEKKDNYKIIIRNSLLISMLFISAFSSAILYNNLNNINLIKANTLISNNIPSEKIINSKNNLSIYKIDYNKKYEIIVNKANPINNDILSLYEQVNVENNLYDNIKIEKEAYKNYLELKKAVTNKGYFLNIKSGFDSTNTSEHATGLALDVIITNKENKMSTNYSSDEYMFFNNIIYLYGFILRYPKNKEKITGYYYEPSHIRYVGKDLAKYLTKNNLTLEEYYEEGE